MVWIGQVYQYKIVYVQLIFQLKRLFILNNLLLTI